MSNSNPPAEKPPPQNYPTTSTIRYKKPGKSAFAQVLATLIQNWLLIDIGLQMSIATVVIGALHNNHSTAESLTLNDGQASWFGSLQPFCVSIGSLHSGFFQEYFGPRGSMIVINIPMLAAWFILRFANSVHDLYAVSIITGLCIGLSESPLHTYIGEIGEPHLRGTLSTISTSAAGLGFLAMFVLGYLFGWRTVALICSACPVITFFCLMQIPETPSRLIVRGQLEEAKKSLCWLRGWVQPEEVEEELKATINYTKNSTDQSKLRVPRPDNLGTDQSVESNGRNIVRKLKTEMKTLMNRKVLLPMRMVSIVFVITSIAGLAGLRPYTINELKDLGFPIDAMLFLIVIQMLFFAGNVANVVFLRRFGKRKLALFSYGVAAASIFGIGTYSSFLKGSVRLPNLAWVPLILFSVLSFLAGFGIILLPWQYVCEIFPLVGRGTAIGVSAAWSPFVDFVAMKSFLYLKAWMNFSGVMYLYAACAVLGEVYLYFYLPETEGKTLEQIESYFTKNHDRKEKFSVGKSKNVANP